ncbi:sigma-70 family RNA polymerase sigma factor [Jiangella anatolica]|uniref:RNA polymerase sigma factor 70 region 4 type 2 domain-containing protein n=1 Tax=Jiangella anatolica TaxID=2670374 RepID=A0A2W2BL90_9ACTN|nr:hypothetical protein C1I92_22895 [Jiangella anatolica]
MRRSQSRVRRGRLWPGAPPEVAGGETAIVIRSALVSVLATLGVRQRAVVVLRYYCDLSDEQIAEILGCSPRTVRSQASRAPLARLRATAAGVARRRPRRRLAAAGGAADRPVASRLPAPPVRCRRRPFPCSPNAHSRRR